MACWILSRARWLKAVSGSWMPIFARSLCVPSIPKLSTPILFKTCSKAGPLHSERVWGIPKINSSMAGFTLSSNCSDMSGSESERFANAWASKDDILFSTSVLNTALNWSIAVSFENAHAVLDSSWFRNKCNFCTDWCEIADSNCGLTSNRVAQAQIVLARSCVTNSWMIFTDCLEIASRNCSSTKPILPQDQAKFANSWGISSEVIVRIAAVTCSINSLLRKPNTAKAQAVFVKFWDAKLPILLIDVCAMASQRGRSMNKSRAKAQMLLASSWAAKVSKDRNDTSAMDVIKGEWKSTVANAQTKLDSDCASHWLITDSAISDISSKNIMSLYASFAKAQSVLDNSFGIASFMVATLEVIVLMNTSPFTCNFANAQAVFAKFWGAKDSTFSTHWAEIASKSSSFRQISLASDHAVADKLWEPKADIFFKATSVRASKNVHDLEWLDVATAANAHKVFDRCKTRKLGNTSMADAAKELKRVVSAITIIAKAHELFAISCAPKCGNRCWTAFEMDVKNIESRIASLANDQAILDKVCGCAWSISANIFFAKTFNKDVLCTSNFANAQLMFEMCCCVYSPMLRMDSMAIASIKGWCKKSCFAKAQTVLALSWALKLESFAILSDATVSKKVLSENSTVEKAHAVLEIFCGAKWVMPPFAAADRAVHNLVSRISSLALAQALLDMSCEPKQWICDRTCSTKWSRNGEWTKTNRAMDQAVTEQSCGLNSQIRGPLEPVEFSACPQIKSSEGRLLHSSLAKDQKMPAMSRGCENCDRRFSVPFEIASTNGSPRSELFNEQVAKAHAVLVKSCTLNSDMRLIQAAEIILYNGVFWYPILAKDHATFWMFCGSNWSILSCDCDANIATSGTELYCKIATAHAVLEICYGVWLYHLSNNCETIFWKTGSPTAAFPSGTLAIRWNAVTKFTVSNSIWCILHNSSKSRADVLVLKRRLSLAFSESSTRRRWGLEKIA